MQVDWRDRRLLADLYLRQEAAIRVADEDLEPEIIGRVRQCCPIYPLLYSIYAEVMMKEALGKGVRNDVDDDETGDEDGVRIGGQIVNDVRFADDQAMVSYTEAGLQEL